MNQQMRNIFIVFISAAALFAAAALIMLNPFGKSDNFVRETAFDGTNKIIITTAEPVDTALLDVNKFTVFEENDPDILTHPARIKQKQTPNGNALQLKFADPLNKNNTHIVDGPELKENLGPLRVSVSHPYWAYLISIMISALLINNYVFTKYLGLCVFMGTSRRKSTAVGMGIVFTIVMLLSAVMSWFFNQYVLIPYNLEFLQVVVFIGLVSLTVQAVDTILRKINPILFKSFGVFLVLVIANCIIIAVPLYMASNNYSLLETVMLALGAGGGFLLALYLMSSVRERIDLAPIPESFKGLPIAFIIAGQFALAFLGFSGLQLF